MLQGITLLTAFALAMALTVLMPRLMERLRLPSILGFIIAGFLLGPAVLGVLKQDGQAITLDAAGVRLLDSGFVNAVVIVIVVTCVLGPILTTRYATRMLAEVAPEPGGTSSDPPAQALAS